MVYGIYLAQESARHLRFCIRAIGHCESSHGNGVLLGKTCSQVTKVWHQVPGYFFMKSLLYNKNTRFQFLTWASMGAV